MQHHHLDHHISPKNFTAEHELISRKNDFESSPFTNFPIDNATNRYNYSVEDSESHDGTSYVYNVGPPNSSPEKGRKLRKGI